ncbi:MAG: hypothetical protein KF805_09940 [Phycisphaeraceae bacterium]|nr:hypothetical protein [Phycisphaeraceae bacterium]
MSQSAWWWGAVCLQVAAASAFGTGREMTEKERLKSGGVIKIIRTIKDDTKARGIDGTFMAPWTDSLVMGAWNPSPDDPTFGTASLLFAVTPDAPASGTFGCSTSADVNGVIALETRIELIITYFEPVLTSAPATLRFRPHSIPADTAFKVTLTGQGGVLATKELTNPNADVLFSIATPGLYGFETESVWTSGALPIGLSHIQSPVMTLDGALDSGASCPADLTVDQQVDDADFVGFSGAYNILDCADPAMPAGCPADLNLDGFVDDTDFVIFAAAYDALLCD